MPGMWAKSSDVSSRQPAAIATTPASVTFLHLGMAMRLTAGQESPIAMGVASVKKDNELVVVVVQRATEHRLGAGR